MCNEFSQEKTWKEYYELMQCEAFAIVSDPPELPLASGSVRPSERAVIISARSGGSALELLAWGWPPPGGKGLVINLRSENRKDPAAMRGVAPVDRFYEFRGEKAPKSKFEFTAFGNQPLGFAVIKKAGRFALLTTEPNADVAEIHPRMPVILPTRDWRRFLTDPDWPMDLAAPSPAQTLKSLQVR